MTRAPLLAVGIVGDARVHRDDDAVRPSVFRVPADDDGERVGQLADERGAVGRPGEPHLGIEPECGVPSRGHR